MGWHFWHILFTTYAVFKYSDLSFDLWLAFKREIFWTHGQHSFMFRFVSGDLFDFFCISNGAFVKTAVDQECSLCTRSESIIQFFWSLVLPMHTKLYLGFVSSSCLAVFMWSTDLNTPSLRIFDKSGCCCCCSCMPLAFCKSFATKIKERLTSYLSYIVVVVVVVVVVVNECEKKSWKSVKFRYVFFT